MKVGANVDDETGGVQTTHWFWGAAGRIQKAVDRNQIAREADPEPVDKPVDISTDISADQELNDLILQNPQVSGAALVQAMKSRGLKVVKTTEAFFAPARMLREFHLVARESNHLKNSTDKLLGRTLKVGAPKEAVAASSNAQFTREAKFHFRPTNLRESASDDGVGVTKFEVILIQEGLGNFGDAFYYHREALESAVPVFTGAKIYADHPSTQEEEVRPERSVRDVLGHFENLKIVESKDGRAMLSGEVNVLPDKCFEWARSLMIRAVENSKKFPDKDFVGLSINASGDADPTPIDDVLKDAPASAKPKLVEAKEKGIESVKVVRSIHAAVSCDLVTEAGAGGKIINFIEGKKP